jgi:hypothetical protein
MSAEGEVSDFAAFRISELAQELDLAKDRVRVLEVQVATLEEDNDTLAQLMLGAKSEVKRLRKEQDQALRRHKRYADGSATAVLEYWHKVVSPSAREVESPRRLRPVLDRLDGGYTVEELCRCCDGYALKPYVVNGKRTHEGPKDDWRADAELVFRDAKRVDAGLAIAERADDLRQVFAEQNSPPAGTSSAISGEISALGQSALRLAARGLLVFPCRAREKRPATKNGLKDATTDLRRIETAWRRWPDMNVAVATGAVSGVVVLDVDGDDGWDSLHDLEDRHELLPDTKSLTTPSGGQHFWFKHPGAEIRNTAGFPGPGLDVRGDGGYVLVPPSVGTNGVAYTVDDESPPVHMPVWLVEMLRRYQAKADQALKGSTDWPAFLADAPSLGERDARMTKYVGHLFHVGMDSREVYATAALLNALSKPPMADKQLVKIVQSIARRDRR